MEEMFQGIYKELASYLPEGWEKVVFMANYSEGSYSMIFYVKKDGAYIDYHDLGYSKMQLMKLFMAVNKIIKPVRGQLTGKDLWYTMTLCVGADGDFKAEFDYDDISDHYIAYTEEWKKKYLV